MYGGQAYAFVLRNFQSTSIVAVERFGDVVLFKPSVFPPSKVVCCVVASSIQEEDLGLHFLLTYIFVFHMWASSFFVLLCRDVVLCWRTTK